MMKDLMVNEDFSDVTLVTEDRKQIKANINILSACSPFFKDIFVKEKNLSPIIIYLRGVQYSEMESIIQFIYLGEATFYVERMEEFLAVGKLLEIKELCNAQCKTDDEPNDEPSPIDQVKLTVKMDEQNLIADSDQKIMQATPDRREGVVSLNGNLECEQCSMTYSSYRGLYNHIQSVHIKYPCNQCDYKASQKVSLKLHVQAKHEGIKYCCNQCDYQSAHQSSLNRHKQSMHEGVKYACSQCDYQATHKNSLNVHIQSKHEGIMYPCNECDYQAARQSHLTRHIQTKHEGIKYPCGQCDYQATCQEGLSRHIQSKH